MLSRTDAQALARSKLDDAVLLLKNSRHSTAYYLCGHAVEIGLKAAVARTIVAETIPARGTIDKVFTHDFGKLVGLAGLTAELNKAKQSDRFSANWTFVSNWSPDSRYAMIDPFTATGMVQAVGDIEDGVFQWLQKHW